MIKRFVNIKNFGVFKNFSWISNPNLQEFTEKNIIYGWNYSGKTTLSRVFEFLRDKSVPPEYNSVQFKIKLKDGNEYSQDDIATMPLDVQVFNSDYIKDNLHWETDNQINGISFQVGETALFQAQILKNSQKIVSVFDAKLKFQPDIDAFNAFENILFTNISRDIQNQVFNSLIKFNKSDLKKTMAFKTGKLHDFIIERTELKKIQSDSLSVNNKEYIEDISFILSLNELYESVENLCISQPTKSNIEDVLLGKTSEYEWVKTGVLLHKEVDASQCFFCGNTIDPARIEKLNNYFSGAESILRQAISECAVKINKELQQIKQINIPSSLNDLADSYKDIYSEKKKCFDILQIQYEKVLNYLLECLSTKLNGNIFNAIPIGSEGKEVLGRIEEVLADLQSIINQHNDFKRNFDSMQAIARDKLKNHYVADFLSKNKYQQKEKNYNISIRKIQQCNQIISYYEQKNNDLSTKLKSIDLGRDELEKFIKSFLNREDIQIGLTPEDKFYLKRGDKIAKNLSEGEKTAISFSHFLVMLESLHKENKLKDTIIFIDDPISSLDSNHTAQICSLINSFFFRKGLDASDCDKICNCFRQLFISTHNFDFYSFIRDARQMTKKKKEDQNTMLSTYLIKKIDSEQSIITCMPKSIKSYKSEYVYLFSIIYNYYLSGCNEDDENLILMPNAIRRFLEIYTLLKIPGSTDEVDNRIKTLMGEPNELKVLHHFSHFTSFEKVTRHDELIMRMPELTQDLIALLKKDQIHFDSLKGAI